MNDSKEKILLKTVGLRKEYTISKGFFSRSKEQLVAVDNVSIEIKEGKTLGLVGESGCGKSTLGKLILKIEEPSEGKVMFEGEDITELKGKKLKQVRKNIQAVFQDVHASLNPRMKVCDIIQEPLMNFQIGNRESRKERTKELLSIVGLGEEALERYPHEFSGGQKQRITIARALALNPKLILCDEATASLDVSIQAQILNLLTKLKETLGLSYLFISHDIAAVKYISDEIAVMYLGKIVEVINSKNLIKQAKHPYTKLLLSAVPTAEGEKNLLKHHHLIGELPNPLDTPKGCRFYGRCPQGQDVCKEKEPSLKDVAKGHRVACHFTKNNYKGD
ncbi:MAG: ABC transporter ATP-binding protein [Clostridiaceae bacterium]|nr:ABC transporter ATP-binding protein [Clostridiaceae bacterium]